VGKSNDKKKDMRKVRFFACHKNGHYASQYPNNKKKKKEPKVSTSAKVFDYAKKFEKKFSLMTSPLGIDCL